MLKLKEVYTFVACTLVLAFIFGFNDGTEIFSFGSWLNNFFMCLLLSAICLFIYIAAQKYAAKKYDAYTEFKFLFVRRFKVAHESFNPKNIKPVPLGIFLGFLLTIISNGVIFFTGLWENVVDYNPLRRVGREKIRLKEWELAKILFAGPAALIIFLVVATWLGTFGYNTEIFVKIGFWIVLINMIPIPGLDGFQIFFSSRTFWIFGILFVIFTYFLRELGIIGGIILSVLIAAMLSGIYYYKVN